MTSTRVLPVLALAASALFVLAGCAPAPATSTTSPTATSSFCARMVTDSGGLDDKSFNEASWAGMQAAQKKLGIDTKALVSTSDTDLAPNVEQAAESGCGFVLTVGYSLADATTAQATTHPDTDFAIVDDVVDGANIKPIVFDTAQAAYLAGYLAAGVTKTGVVATFGGDNEPPVTLFMDGFVDGVAKYNDVHGTKVKALGWNKKKQDGVFTGDFEDTSKGLSVTQNLIDQKADVILPVAGQVGTGAAAAALSAGNVSIIWVDNDGYNTLSDEYKPILLTSVIKNTTDAVSDIVASSADGTFTNTPFVGTLANGGVSIAPFHDMAPSVSSALSGEIDELKAQIVSGEVVVTSPSTPK